MEPKIILRFLLDSGHFIQAVYPANEASKIVHDWSQKRGMRLYRPEFYEGIDLDHVQAIFRIPEEMLQQAAQQQGVQVQPQPQQPKIGQQFPHTFFGSSGLN